ncbi:MAG: hypothetical protein P1U56_01620 [Saprospiraceae bacterium]|nr:hypothetical protein [Saprospiraceae bacterium]
MTYFRNVLACALFTMFIFSCSDDTELHSTPDEITKRHTTPADPQVNNGVFEFSSKQHLSDFKSYISELETDDRDDLYSRLGFNSLYDSYRTLEEGDANFRDNLDIYVSSTAKQYVLNDAMEIGIAGEYHKYIRQGLYASGPVLSDIQSLGDDQIWKEGVLVTDHENNEIIRPDGSLPDPISNLTPNNGNNTTSVPREPCEIVVSIVNVTQVSLLPFVVRPLIRVEFINDEGGTPFCAGDLTITWGDGSVSNISNVNIGQGGYLATNRYDPAPLGVEVNNITVEFTPSICGLCNSFSSSTVSHVVSNTPSCLDDEFDGHVITLTYGNGDLRVSYYKNYDMEDISWWDAHVGAKVKVQKRNSDGKWKDHKVGKITISFNGVVYREHECTEVLRSVTASKTKFNDNDYHHEIDIDDDYRANEYDNVLITYEVFHSGATFPFASRTSTLFNF